MTKGKRELPMHLRSQTGAWERALLFFKEYKLLAL